MIWRRRRRRATSVATPVPASTVPASTGPAGAPVADPAWQMDQPRHPQVAWNPHADVARADARTDTYSVSSVRPPHSVMPMSSGMATLCCGMTLMAVGAKPGTASASRS